MIRWSFQFRVAGIYFILNFPPDFTTQCPFPICKNTCLSFSTKPFLSLIPACTSTTSVLAFVTATFFGRCAKRAQNCSYLVSVFHRLRTLKLYVVKRKKKREKARCLPRDNFPLKSDECCKMSYSSCSGWINNSVSRLDVDVKSLFFYALVERPTGQKI